MLSQELHTVVDSEDKCSRCLLRAYACVNPPVAWARRKNQYKTFIVQVNGIPTPPPMGKICCVSYS